VKGREINLHAGDCLVRHPYLIQSQLKGENYLFHSKKTVFFTLNSTACFILSLCDGNHSVEDILESVSSECSVPVPDIFTHVVEYLGLLLELEIVENPLSQLKGGESHVNV